MTRPPGASPTWAFTDGVGRTIRTVTRGFDGGLILTLAEHDNLGRPRRMSKPLRPSEPPFWTTTVYDPLSRVQTVTQDLGIIDGTQGPAPAAASVLVTTYLGVPVAGGGSQIRTDQSVNGEARMRIEEKNVLGKVMKVTDADIKSIEYEYDVDGNLRFTFDPAGNSIEMRYDSLGRKVFTQDPDLGTWTYRYSGFGDLKDQTDARGQTTSMRYDVLGRMTRRTACAPGASTCDEGAEGADTAEWVYDEGEGAGKGKLAAVLGPPDSRLALPCEVAHTTLTDGKRAGRSYKYTAFGDVDEITECVDGESFVSTYAYDSLGRQRAVTYPDVGGTRLAVGYSYTSLGYLHYVTDQSDGSVYWAAKAMNAMGQVTEQQTRNGVETVSLYNPSTGWLLGSSSTAHGDEDAVIQSWGHRYDEAGNLRRRVRDDQVTAGLTDETFGYDRVDRLTTSRVVASGGTGGGYDQTETYHYDTAGLGNLTQKNGVVYRYGTGCQAGARAAGPHAVCTVGGGAEYQYDDNGNLTRGGDRHITYGTQNKAIRIESEASGGGAVDFVYGAEGNRVVQARTRCGENEVPETSPIRAPSDSHWMPSLIRHVR